MAKLQRAVGNYVIGDKFWNRENELELFMELLEERAHVLMAAPRRIGKTSIIREVALRLQDRYYCLYVDLQKAESAADAVAELSRATHSFKNIWSKTKEIFRNVIEATAENIESLGPKDLKITLRSGVTLGDWRNKGDQLFEILSEADKQVIVFFDELPILVNRLLKGEDYQITPERRRVTDALMSWIRDNSIRHKDKICIVITGSIGIEPALRQADLSATLNTFTPFSLPAWSREAAVSCLEALANHYGVTFSNGAIDRILEKLGYLIPHHVQLFFDTIYTDCRLNSRMEVTLEGVDEIYTKRMLSVQGHAELSHMEERLKMVFGLEVYKLVLELLTEAAVTGSLQTESGFVICESYDLSGRPCGEILRDVLEILQHDGYLQQEGDKLVFVSNLLKDWWKARLGYGYVPVSKRRS